jgi:hypothetical protein
MPHVTPPLLQHFNLPTPLKPDANNDGLLLKVHRVSSPSAVKGILSALEI